MPGFWGMPVLAGSLAQLTTKQPAQVGGRAETGAPGNLAQGQVGLPQQRANPIRPATDDFAANAGLQPAAEALLHVGARAAHVGQHVLDADAVVRVIANESHRLDGNW